MTAGVRLNTVLKIEVHRVQNNKDGIIIIIITNDNFKMF